ncbi:MAG: ABC transporter transmembrane domain-containing protein [Lachnospiraceae bacterium]
MSPACGWSGLSGGNSYEIDRFDEKNETFAGLWIKVGRLMSVYWGAGDFLTGIQIMTVLILGTVLTVQGEMTLGGMMAFVSYNASCPGPSGVWEGYCPT